MIKDYLETVGKKTFAEVPFNEIDFAICGSLSYADFVATSIYSTFNHWEDRVPLSVFNKHAHPGRPWAVWSSAGPR